MGIGSHGAKASVAQAMTVTTAIRQGKVGMRAFMLPRPRAAGKPGLPDEPLIVAGMFRTGNGIGRAARSCYDALRAEGFDPIAVDLSSMFHQADMESAVQLGSIPRRERGTLILFANPPEVERALMGLGLRRWHNWRIIGAWAWELPAAPAEWTRQTRFISEIWAPSRFVADAFAARYDRPVHVVPHFVVPAGADEASADGKDAPLRILTLADGRSSLERKNPAAAVRMFQAAFPRDTGTELVVKCRNLSMFPDYARDLADAAGGDSRITLLDTTLSDREHARLLAHSDIVLSAHRSEGFGFHLAEAMAAGKSVIATGWSGNLEFMSADASLLLPYTLRPVVDPTGIYSGGCGSAWADVDFDAGVDALRSLAGDGGKRRQMGARAKDAIKRRLGSDAYRNALELPVAKGEAPPA